ncbi:aspartate-alanine antiporter, partial [Planctomycetota bacterium]
MTGFKFELGSARGLLLLGLLVGYLRSLFPVFGRVPEGTQWIFTELSLLIFLACVTLRGGANLVPILEASGFTLILAGIIV